MTKRRLDIEPTLACDAHPAFVVRQECDLVRAVSCWLQDMVRHYDSLEWRVTASGLQRTNAFPVSVFHGRPLSSSIEDFIHKICTCAKLDESVVLVAAVYLSRILEKADGKLPVSSCTVHRLLLQALTVGAKFVLDHPRSNKAMASFANLPVNKFNQLEVKFLCAIQYDLAVSPADMAIAKDALELLPACAHVQKKSKVAVLQDNSNQSSVAGGVAASNNSVEKDGEENSHEDAATENNNYINGLGNGRDEKTMATLLGMAAPESAYSNNDMSGGTDTDTAVSPMWSQSSGCSSTNPTITQQLGTCADSKESNTKDVIHNAHQMPPGSTPRLSTPERRGAYSLVATAAE